MHRIAIIGLGYVGLPLAAAFAEAGTDVIGIDTDTDKLAALNRGISRVEDVPSEKVRTLADAGKLRFTKDYSALGDAQAIIICLPTPLNEYREPDLSHVVDGAERVSGHLAPGALVVLESTTYPGTTREVVLPILERGGRVVGRDFLLAFSPERVDPGNKKFTLANTPKVVGGISSACAAKAEALYRRIAGEVHPVSTPESAELSKLLENIFRGVNIALVNELAVLCDRMGIDIWEVVDAAATKPFGFMPFYPGPGLGGHCVPIDPFYLAWRARAFDMNTEFIELAGRVNVNMPRYAFGRIGESLNKGRKAVNGSKVLMLGMSYKPNVGDLRESPCLEILRLLRESGAEVAYHDPYVPSLPEYGLASVPLGVEEIQKADCVVIGTDHDSIDLPTIVSSSLRIVDLRNAIRKKLGSNLPENVDVL